MAKANHVQVKMKMKQQKEYTYRLDEEKNIESLEPTKEFLIAERVL